MAKKKVAKKAVKKAAPKAMPMNATCSTSDTCYCKPILALTIILLTWWKPTEMWSQVTITIAAAIIFLMGDKCACRK